MKKHFILTLAVSALLLIAMPLKAQIYIDDESMNNRATPNPNSIPDMPFIPELNTNQDRYAPLGGEMLVLGLLGGAYLLGKKRKESKVR